MNITLEIRPTEERLRAPAAWFLPGGGPEHWVAELVRCGLATAAVRLFVIPQSSSDRTPAGLLVVGNERRQGETGPSGLACGMIEESLCVPVDARLWPDIDPQEIRHLCGGQLVFIHPTLGAFAFASGEGIGVSDLLGAPASKSADWNRARQATHSSRGLENVVLISPPRIEDLFQDAIQEIGSDPDADLPPAPGEGTETPRERMVRMLREMLEMGEAGSGQGPSGAGWKGRFWKWAHSKLQHSQQELQQLRDRAIGRLLHQLKSDPEAGLRHAIPVNGGAHRGIAPQRAHLGERQVDFDFSKIGPSGPSDFWNVPPDLHSELLRQYRLLADRELKLGRYRRAAYVYAHLLGDLSSAAQTLKQGGHYREAALLYEDQLNNPEEAARCLAEGGMLQEAIERFEKLENWKEAAELLEKLGQRDRAATLWRRIVDQCRAKSDHFGAAALLEEKLALPDEAIAELSSAWPDSAQSIRCLAAKFELLRRLGRNDDATALVQELRKFDGKQGEQLGYLEIISEQARRYPDARVRSLSADLCRVVASRQLSNPEISVWTATRVVEHLIQLTPQDRLLLRDANRYLIKHRARPKPPGASAPREEDGKSATKFQLILDSNLERIKRINTRSTSSPTKLQGGLLLIRTIEAPKPFRLIAACSEESWFYLVGKEGNNAVVVRGVWSGEIQSVVYPESVEGPCRQAVFEPGYDQGRSLILSLEPGKPLPPRDFPASDLLLAETCRIQPPSWLPYKVHPVSFGPRGSWCLHQAGGRKVLSSHDLGHKLQQTLDVTEELSVTQPGEEESSICLLALEQSLVMACGRQLMVFHQAGGGHRLELPSRVVRLFRCPAPTLSAVAVAMETGAGLHCIGTREWVELDRDSSSPLGCSIPGGPIVLVSGKECQLLELDAKGVHRVTRCTLPCDPPMAILPAREPGQFALISANGRVSVFSTRE